MADISFTQNRELSWLKFDQRVLEEANDRDVPVLERLRFFSIFDTNLEEFFMVRVGSLTDFKNLKKKPIDSKSGMTSDEQLDAILSECVDLYKQKDQVYAQIVDELKVNGINLLKVSELNEKDKKSVEYYFNTKIEPILNFQVVDRVHPFPRLPNLALCLVFSLVADNDDESKSVGLIQVPDKIKRYLKINDTTFVFIEDIIKEFGYQVFEGYEVENKSTISLTRNTDISYDDDDYDIDQDFRDYMKGKLKKRKRLHPVRLEIDNELSEQALDFLKSQFDLDRKNIFVTKSLMQAGFLFGLVEDLPENLIAKHTYDPFSPQASAMVDPNSPMMEQINEKDIFLSFPYESMDPVIRLLEEAADDESVVSIKITLYRIAHDSKIAKALIKASENGKDVIVLMELRARFDEDNNILWSSKLEDAGCKILYGFDNYKTHSKICLITKVDQNDNIQYITQVATGNYNEKTAKLYTDFSLMTSSGAIGLDAKDLFDNVMLGNLEGEYKNLMVSPKSMQDGLDKLIDDQIQIQKQGGQGYIRVKLNSISDRILIDKLSEASNEGVKIVMLVRGICCILPGVKNRTENIEIYSIVGRFLEHHRVYQFGQGENAKVYISSADFMTRNIRHRMEVAVPIFDDDIKKRILDFMDLMLSDDVKIRKLLSNGEYTKVQKVNNIDAQAVLVNNAKKRSINAEEKRAVEKVAQKNKRQHENQISEQRKNLKKEKSYFRRILDIFRK
ncbi:RNA degradosome polyphosphate kinase [Anaerococcus sp. mt242]|uniref:RNA degradosome polyphosphate kinase n=1 Tax=Anaerococcus sp. mt242 TaxID=2661917 RepID=UPI0019324E56|nr:RNA degradosome polyphosphate kinase [Anaerococcus sp. mt242]MBM0046570.1 RNA degradosome polyphosphate kinase [Anaerococcus sp. mt242]